MRALVSAAALILLPACSPPPRAVPGGDAERGKEQIVATGCGACHVIGGVRGATGRVGPPLTGVGARSVIGGVLPNNPDNLSRWIADAPAISPNTAMPNLGLTIAQSRDITAYLYERQ